jgi:hypothetical protein
MSLPLDLVVRAVQSIKANRGPFSESRGTHNHIMPPGEYLRQGSCCISRPCMFHFTLAGITLMLMHPPLHHALPISRIIRS